MGAQSWTTRRVLGLLARTAGTFTVIAVLWSLWTSASIGEWLAVWRTGLGRPTVQDTRLVAAALVAAGGFAAATVWFAMKERSRIRGSRPAFVSSVARVIAAILAVCLIGSPELYARYLPARLAGTYVSVVSSTREIRLSGHDADMLQRGYYEDLLSVQSFNSQLWEVYSSWPLNWSRLEDTGVLRLTGDFLYQDLAPSMEIHFRNATLRTNRWGMRDKDYERQPPPGTYRFALVGSSHVMGYGVDDDETFDAVLEERLNKERIGASRHYEVLNFAVDGYTPTQELFQLETRDLEFKLDTVLYVAHFGAPHRAALHLVDMARSGVRIPYPELDDILQRAGVSHGIGRFEGQQRIRRYQDEILSWTYRRMVTDIRTRGSQPVWVYLPQMGDHVPPEALAHFIRMAEDAGFTTISLADCFDGVDPKSVVFGEWDRHPNALGHRLIAEKLFQRLQEKGMDRANTHVR